ncbi:hypothetical protein CSOJ01_07899 [Colletotrichum sojae]|uniref:Uncharacterized protein n=1 Tax=Colletotrichum sojae TaxID=2175907 RepID=A0A8H6MSX8_9PEZI|nr:hypothetical protein CSOJ01_07899 [Colletotrichum sojae]
MTPTHRHGPTAAALPLREAEQPTAPWEPVLPFRLDGRERRPARKLRAVSSVRAGTAWRYHLAPVRRVSRRNNSRAARPRSVRRPHPVCRRPPLMLILFFLLLTWKPSLGPLAATAYHPFGPLGTTFSPKNVWFLTEVPVTKLYSVVSASSQRGGDPPLERFSREPLTAHILLGLGHVMSMSMSMFMFPRAAHG